MISLHMPADVTIHYDEGSVVKKRHDFLSCLTSNGVSEIIVRNAASDRAMQLCMSFCSPGVGTIVGWSGNLYHNRQLGNFEFLSLPRCVQSHLQTGTLLTLISQLTEEGVNFTSCSIVVGDISSYSKGQSALCGIGENRPWGA